MMKWGWCGVGWCRVVQGGAGCPRVALAEVESLDDLRFGILLLNWAVKRCPKPNVERAKSIQENSREKRGEGDGRRRENVGCPPEPQLYFILHNWACNESN